MRQLFLSKARSRDYENPGSWCKIKCSKKTLAEVTAIGYQQITAEKAK